MKCIAKGLCTNIASLVATVDPNKSTTSNKPWKKGQSNSAFQPQQSSPYRTVIGSQDVFIHPTSSLFTRKGIDKLPKYVVYAEILVTTKHYMRYISVLEQSWLGELNIPFLRVSGSVAGES